MSVFQRVRTTFSHAFSRAYSAQKRPSNPVAFSLLMLAAMIMMYAPHSANAQTELAGAVFNYVGAPLSNAGNDPNCPVINNLTGSAVAGPQGPAGGLTGTLTAGPFSGVIEPTSDIAVNSDGVIFSWFVVATSPDGSKFFITREVGALGQPIPTGVGGDGLSGNFVDPNGNQVGCVYTNSTPGTWSSGLLLAAANNLGGSSTPVNPGTGALAASAPGNGCPGSIGNPSPGSDSAPSCMVADPVNVATGNQFEAETDFMGAPNTALGLTRHYNSQDTTASQFGKNWHSTWHRGLVVNGNSVTVTRADGREDIFTNNGSGVYTADPDVTSEATRHADLAHSHPGLHNEAPPQRQRGRRVLWHGRGLVRGAPPRAAEAGTPRSARSALGRVRSRQVD
jgi:hypothetical protein